MADFHGSFVWYELMTSDPAAAGAFYTDVVGWTAADPGIPGIEGYTIFSADRAGVAGIMAMPEAARAAGWKPGWLGHIGVADVDATAAQAEREGGAIHRAPADIPGVGRFAVLLDPQGAAISIFKPRPAGDMPPPAPPGTPGHAGWRELFATDWTAAFAFYAALFGWTTSDAVDMGPMGTYQTFGVRGGEKMGGMMNRPAAMPAPFWNYYFTVDGLDAAVARLQAGGGRVLNGPHQVPGGSWIVQALDPEGAMTSLTSARR